MDDNYDWNSFDQQSQEYLNSSDYKGDSFTTPDNQVWGGYDQLQGGINQQGQNDIGSYLGQQNLEPMQWENSMSGLTTGGQGYDFSGGAQYMNPSQITQQGMDWGQMGTKGMDALGNLFKGGAGILGANQGQQNNTNQMLKGLASLWAAQQEKKAQGQLGQQNAQAAQQMQQNTNPFAAQRPRYQQELSDVQDRLNAFRQNPNANQQYKTLQDQIISQANRGSRQRGTSDVQMAAALAPQLTKSQMDFENQMINDRAGLYQPAGAGLNSSAGILEAMLGANKSSTMADSNAGYASAIGRLLQGGSNQQTKNVSDEQIQYIREQLGL